MTPLSPAQVAEQLKELATTLGKSEPKALGDLMAGPVLDAVSLLACPTHDCGQCLTCLRKRYATEFKREMDFRDDD